MSDLAPTKSLPWQMQKNGRVLRMKDDPAYIFDHAGNVDRHGLPDDDREWTLEGKEKKKQGEKTEPTRQCEVCYFCHRPAQICPHCGNIYPIKGRSIEEIEGELIEIARNAKKIEAKEIRKDQGMAKTMTELVEQGKSRGMKNPHAWAKHVFNARARKS
jgi:superfamily II DNA or RNA helicase